MEHFKRFWHYVLIEPYIWMFYSTFQPKYFKREMESAIFARHATLLETLRHLVPTRWKEQFDHLHVLRNIAPSLKLYLPLFLVFYIALLLIRVVPYALFPALNPDFYTHELATSHIFDLLLKMAEYAAIGVGLGIFFGCLFGIKAGTVLGVTGGIIALEVAIITTTNAINVVAIFATFCFSIGFFVASGAEEVPSRISAGSAIGIIIGIVVTFGSDKIINPLITYGMGYLVGFAEELVLATIVAFGFSLIVASAFYRIVNMWLKRSAFIDTFIVACTIAVSCSAGFIFGTNPLWLFLCFSIVIGVLFTYLVFVMISPIGPSPYGYSKKMWLIPGACVGVIGGTLLASLIARTYYQHSTISPEKNGIGLLLLAIPLGVGTAFAIRALIGNTLRLRADVAICLGVCVTLSIGTSYFTFLLLFLGYLIGCYRIPFYPVSFFSGLKAYLNSLHTPSTIFTNLHHTSLYWDERVYLPYPFLMPLLLMAAEQDSTGKLVWQEISYIRTQRPQQSHIARAVALQLIIRDLRVQQNLTAMASMASKLEEILSANPDLFDALSLGPLTDIKEACLYAEECCRSTRRSTKQEALEQMTERLQNIQPQTMFRRGLWTRHLDRLIHDWLKIIQREQEKLGNYQT